VPKRRADWLAGRLGAKAVAARALADGTGAGWPAGAIEIATGPEGAPFARLAPDQAPRAGFAPGARLPIALSISHAEGHALCAAAWTGEARAALGIDLGAIEPRSPAFLETFLTAEERRFAGDGDPAGRSARENLVWCAKEAVLKALGVGLRVDTHHLACLPAAGTPDPGDWPLAPADPGWRPFTAACGPALVPGGATIRGLWRTFPGFVAALARHGRP
jgi:4'-phosphopantetheinyl transferase